VIHPVILRAAFGRAWPLIIAVLAFDLLMVVLTLIWGG
jgi:hypothetical protein